jgi:predicted dehydrogenase
MLMDGGLRMADPLHWGLLSTAKINNSVIKPIKESKNHQLVAVASRSLDKAIAYAAEKGIPKAYGSYDELLADPQVDAVYISLPNRFHAEWTIKACQAGKNVLCEKPLALSLEEVDAIQVAAQKAGVVVEEAFMYRHHPLTLKVKEMLDKDAVGRIRMIRGVFTFFLAESKKGRLVPAGGGSLWDVGCYPINCIRTMLNAMPEDVFCWQVTGPTGVDLNFSGEMRFPGDILAQFQSGFNAREYTSMEIMGESGSLFVSNPFSPGINDEINYLTDQRETILEKGMDSYIGELDDMADCILMGKSPLITLEDSRKNTKVILACIESARTGKVVKLG